MAKKKFDTNPLDPDFPEKVRENETAILPDNQFKTADLPPFSVTEEKTRRFENENFNAYQSPYDGQNIPSSRQSAGFAATNPASSSRSVSKIGMPEKWLIALPYVPFYVGFVASLIILFIVPKSETKVRFHAAQGLAAHLAILLISAVLGGLGNLVDAARTGNSIFQIVTMVMLIVFTIKAWQGKPVHIESVDDLTNWLDEKIQPKK